MGKKEQLKQIIHPKVRVDNYKALKHIQQTRHVSIGEVVDEALTQYFAPPGEDEDTALLLRRLDRLGKQNSIMEGNMKIMAEMLALYIRIFLTNTDEVPKQNLQTALAKGNRRYKGFIEKVASDLATSEGQLSELLQKAFLAPQPQVRSAPPGEEVELEGEFD